MTGGAFFPTAAGDDEYDLGDERHAVQWIGTAGVKGPKWARMPLLTVGMLGIQCVWSIEMGYASPYLLELGLSKSWMSLVFMAGPLSGLIVQPLIGIFADRSRSPLGRRRPFMLAGCAICVFAMMLLGWTREVAGWFGAGPWMAIGLAVWAIYLIDFSINAVMSTDRALVVDTLPPKEQEEGSAWAGRMFGFGSVAGFFVQPRPPPVLPFLGKTQLQILSFMTSAILMISHIFTSWGVTERVLLRDDRPHSQSTLRSNLKSIWDNTFSLPPGIRTICKIQFFASLGWFPILFFTTVWVSEIYKASVPNDGLDEATFAADAVRSGSRALLLQALVNVATSVGLPFLVTESGVQPQTQAATSAWKGQGVAGILTRLKDASVPIPGLTLIKVWWISQFIFAGAMAASWFVTTIHGAYLVIAVTGFCWSLSQWAPYSILGELILLDGGDHQPISAGESLLQSDPAEADPDSTVVLRHSDEMSEPGSRPSSPHPPQDRQSTADKAGVILGIHNVFLVLPQFVVTFLSSIIFYLMEPDRSLPVHHPGAMPVAGNTTEVEEVTAMLRVREGPEGSPDAVGLIFRIGGVSAAVGAYLCLRLARSWAAGTGP